MTFDPNKPFTPGGQTKKSFDPSRPFQPANAQPPSFINKMLADPHMGSGILAKAGVDPERVKQAQMAEDQVETPRGVQSLAAAALLPRAAVDLGPVGALQRIATAVAQGGTSNVAFNDPNEGLSDKLRQFLKGGAVGGVLQGAGEVASKGLGLVKQYAGNFARMSPAQSDAYLGDASGTENMAKQLGNAAEDPQGMVDLQNRAKDAIGNSRAVLKAKGLQNAGQLRTMLDGKSATINPADYEGLDPEVDDLLQKARAQLAQSQSVVSPTTQPELNLPYNEPASLEKANPSFQEVGARQPTQPPTADNLKHYFAKLAGLAQDESPAVGGSANTEVTPEAVSNFKDAAGLSSNEVPAVGREAASSSSPDALQNFKQMVSPEPESLDVGLNDLNDIKRILQQKSQFAPGTVVDPQQAARNSLFASKSHGLRTLIEREGGEGVAPLNQEMQDSILLQKALRSGAKNSPLAFVSSESPDRMATLARAETKGAGGLFDFGNQFGAAKAIAGKNVGSGVDASLLKAAGRAGLRGQSLFAPSVEEFNDNPVLKQFLLNASLKDNPAGQ